MSLKARIEAVIYAAEEPVTLPQLTAIFREEALASRAARLAAEAPSSTAAAEAVIASEPGLAEAEMGKDADEDASASYQADRGTAAMRAPDAEVPTEAAAQNSSDAAIATLDYAGEPQPAPEPVGSGAEDALNAKALADAETEAEEDARPNPEEADWEEADEAEAAPDPLAGDNVAEPQAGPEASADGAQPDANDEPAVPGGDEEGTPEFLAEAAADDGTEDADLKAVDIPLTNEGGPEAQPDPTAQAADADGTSGTVQSPSPEDEKKIARQREREVREEIRRLVDQLIAEYSTTERGIEIREVAGGFRMATRAEYHDSVRAFVKSLKPPMKLSLQALETLAVIAYKQPITAPEIGDVRGVDSGGVLGSLVARKLITTAGRKQVIGRPILYKTTREFLLRFGLRDLSELPSIEEFEKMASELAEPEEQAPATAEELPFTQDASAAAEEAEDAAAQETVEESSAEPAAQAEAAEPDTEEAAKSDEAAPGSSTEEEQ